MREEEAGLKRKGKRVSSLDRITFIESALP
jgi:hypothetical protein